MKKNVSSKRKILFFKFKPCHFHVDNAEKKKHAKMVYFGVKKKRHERKRFARTLKRKKKGRKRRGEKKQTTSEKFGRAEMTVIGTRSRRRRRRRRPAYRRRTSEKLESITRFRRKQVKSVGIFSAWLSRLYFCSAPRTHIAFRYFKIHYSRKKEEKCPIRWR